MSGLFPIAGSKIYIGSRVNPKGTVDLSDFAGQTWTEIDGWTNAGEIGDTQEVGEQALINDRRVRKFKTTLNAGNMDNQFVPMFNDPGQKIFAEAIDSCQPYAFKIEWGADCVPQQNVSISLGTPGIVSWSRHGMVAGQPISFDGSAGTLPDEIDDGEIYYVVEPITPDSFAISATSGGTAIDTTAASSGTVVASAPPAGMTDYFYGMALPGSRSGGGAADLNLRTWSIAVDSNIITV